MKYTRLTFLALAGTALAIGAMGLANSRPDSHALPQLTSPAPGSATDCAALANLHPLTLLVVGQSNAGNHGSPIETPMVPVIHGNGCYFSRAPLPGATGNGGSPWPWLASTLHDRPVIVAVVAAESTTIAQWLKNTPLHRELAERIAGVRHLGFHIDAVLWQQGEADMMGGTTSADYEARLLALRSDLHSLDVHAPLIAARSTYCKGHSGTAVREAIERASARRDDIVLGPDTDRLRGNDRADDCHFSAQGQQAAARLWADTLVRLKIAGATR